MKVSSLLKIQMAARHIDVKLKHIYVNMVYINDTRVPDISYVVQRWECGLNSRAILLYPLQNIYFMCPCFFYKFSQHFDLHSQLFLIYVV